MTLGLVPRPREPRCSCRPVGARAAAELSGGGLNRPRPPFLIYPYAKPALGSRRPKYRATAIAPSNCRLTALCGSLWIPLVGLAGAMLTVAAVVIASALALALTTKMR